MVGQTGTDRGGIPLIQIHGGCCGPDVDAFCADDRTALTPHDAALLLRISPARLVSAFALVSGRERISRGALMAFCQANAGTIWLWQRTYAANARP